MKRYLVLTTMALGLSLAWVSTALGWGMATHAYIDNQLGKHGIQKNYDEMYGGLGADVFNMMFTHPQYIDFLYGKIHYEAGQVWEVAGKGPAKGFAFGLMSHNGQWGADSTAHHAGLTFGLDQGYVIAKAERLVPLIRPVLAAAGLPLPDTILLDVCHNFVEYGIEMLVKQADPDIGRLMEEAALNRTPRAPAGLAAAFSDDLAGFAGISQDEAAGIIIGAETAFREDVILYGTALQMDDAASLQFLAQHLAGVAHAYLASKGIILPPEANIVPLISYGIQGGMALCAADVGSEIDATIDFVADGLAGQGVRD